MEKTAYYYFKLFNNIKEKHEVDFAELELSSFLGDISRVRNFTDFLYSTPFRHFIKHRIQDILAHELPYGECQGFFTKLNCMNVTSLVKRLAYIREIFVVIESVNPEISLEEIFPLGEKNRNLQIFKANAYVLFRFITNQYYLEKSEYISKLSRNEDEADSNIDALLDFLTKKLYRIPASTTSQVGKRLEDYFTIREEPSLYLTHYMHPYKGKFHPRMVRAILNYIYPKEEGLVMDNFAGCGTLLVEATWMGLDNIGVEINPLSVLMSNVKCSSLSLSPNKLKDAIENYSKDIKQALARASTVDKYNTKELKEKIPEDVKSKFNKDGTLEKILIANEEIKKIKDKTIHDFLLLGLSGTISDLTRRSKKDFFEALEKRLENLYLRIYIFHKLNKILKIKLGKSETHVADTRDMKMIKEPCINAIVNSPPYSTALDYIKNDYPQLVLLELADIESLEKNMMGFPRLRGYPEDILDKLFSGSKESERFPEEAKDILSKLRNCGRTKEAARTYKFFNDMYFALKEMYRVMIKGSKCAIIIGNNHYKINDEYEEVRNDEVTKYMALDLGFKEDRIIKRELEKTRTGMIRYESIIILEKI